MPHNDQREDRCRDEDRLAVALSFLSREVSRLTDQLERTTQQEVILNRINQLERNIMATQIEITEQLKAATVRQQKTIDEIAVVQGTVTSLNDEVKRLNDLIAQGGAVTPELVSAANEVTRLATLADDQLPDVVPPVPPVE